jgi:hypothetical protein
MILCVRRVPDAMLESSGWFQSLRIELAETRMLPVQGANRLVVVRAGGEPQGAPPAADSPRKSAKAAPSAAATARHAAAAVSLVDEAKKKILRIGDEIEEEVDGGTVRFRLREEILAVLEVGDELTLSLGDAPDLRRPIRDRIALESAVDDVVRRYFALARQSRPRVLNGHAGPA